MALCLQACGLTEGHRRTAQPLVCSGGGAHLGPQGWVRGGSPLVSRDRRAPRRSPALGTQAQGSETSSTGRPGSGRLWDPAVPPSWAGELWPRLISPCPCRAAAVLQQPGPPAREQGGAVLRGGVPGHRPLALQAHSCAGKRGQLWPCVGAREMQKARVVMSAGQRQA